MPVENSSSAPVAQAPGAVRAPDTGQAGLPHAVRPLLRQMLVQSPWTMVAVAFALRIDAMFLLGTYRFPADHDHYLFGTEMGRIARSIATGHGFGSPFQGDTGPTAIVGPVYPLLIAGVFKVFGIYTPTSAVVLLAVNALCSALTAAVICGIGREAFGGTTGFWAGWIWTFFPFAILFPVVWVWDIGLSALLFSLVFLETLRLQRSGRSWAWAGYGALWGVTVLTNTTFLSLLPFFMAWLWYRQARPAPAARRVGAALLAFGLVLSPWLIRNYMAFGHIVLRSNLGLEMTQGLEVPGGGAGGATVVRASWRHPAYSETELARYRRLGELRYMAEQQREAIRIIEAHPGAFARSTLRKIFYFWTAIETPAQALHGGAILSTLVTVMALAGLGTALVSHRPGGILFLILLLVYPLVYYITHPEPRFRHLIEPELLVLAVSALLPSARRAAAGFQRLTSPSKK